MKKIKIIRNSVTFYQHLSFYCNISNVKGFNNFTLRGHHFFHWMNSFLNTFLGFLFFWNYHYQYHNLLSKNTKYNFKNNKSEDTHPLLPARCYSDGIFAHCTIHNKCIHIPCNQWNPNEHLEKHTAIFSLCFPLGATLGCLCTSCMLYTRSGPGTTAMAGQTDREVLAPGPEATSPLS